jgi:hypothetical protein
VLAIVAAYHSESQDDSIVRFRNFPHRDRSTVRLIPGQFVKPFVKSHKNEFLETVGLTNALRAKPIARPKRQEVFELVARDWIEPPTPAFSGPLPMDLSRLE